MFLLFFIFTILCSFIAVKASILIKVAIFALMVGMVLVSLLSKNRQNFYQLLSIVIIYILLLIVTTVRLDIQQKTIALFGKYENRVVEIEGNVVKKGDRILVQSHFLTVDNKKLKTSAKILCQIGFNSNLRYMDKVKIQGKYKIKDGRIIMKASNTVVVSKTIFTAIFDYRESFVREVRKSMPRPYDSLFVSILIGSMDNKLDRELQAIFKETGLIHVLVVSGAQIAIINNFVISVLAFLMLPRLLIFYIMVLVNATFLIMVGGDVSIIRAVFMSIFSYFLLFKGRESKSLDVLAISGMAFLIVDAHYLFNLSFILSFVATFSLLQIVPKLEELGIRLFPRVPTVVVSYLATGIGPILIITPIIMLINKRFDILALPANLSLLPLIEIIVIIGFCVMPLVLILPFLATILLKVIFGLLVITYFMAGFYYSISWHSVYLKKVLWLNVVAYYLVMFLLLYKPELLKRYYGSAFASCLLVVLLNMYFAKQQLEEVYILNIGKDKVIFMSISGQNLLFSKSANYPNSKSLQKISNKRIDRAYSLGQDKNYQLNVGNIQMQVNNQEFIMSNQEQQYTYNLKNDRIKYEIDGEYTYFNNEKLGFRYTIVDKEIYCAEVSK